jgi:hypothetical protein
MMPRLGSEMSRDIPQQKGNSFRTLEGNSVFSDHADAAGISLSIAPDP